MSAKHIEIPSQMIQRVPHASYSSRDRMFQKTMRKSPITHRSPTPQISASVGDVRIVNNQAVRPMLPAIQPQLQPSFAYRSRRMGETAIHARRFGPSNFWSGTPLEGSAVLGDPMIFEASELFSGWDELGFVWNLKNASLDVYATRDGQTWKVRFSTRRLVHLFNRGLREMGSEKRLPQRATVGWNFFDELGKLGSAINNKMIEPAVRDVGNAIDTVVNNPIVQGIVTGMALIPPLTAIGGPALAAMSIAKGVKTAGDVVGGISTGIKHGFSPESALKLVTNVASGVPGLPPAAKGIMQGALGAAGVGVKLLGGGAQPGAIITQAVSSVPKNIRAELAKVAQEAQAGGLVIPPGLMEGFERVMQVAVPGTRLPRFTVDLMTDGTKALTIATPGGTTIAFNQIARYLDTFAKTEAAKPRGVAADLKRAGINPNLVASAQQGATMVIPKRKRIPWKPKTRQAMVHGGPQASAMFNGASTSRALPAPSRTTLLDAVDALPQEIKVQFAGLLFQRKMTPDDLARYPLIGGGIRATLMGTPALASLKTGLDNFPSLKRSIP